MKKNVLIFGAMALMTMFFVSCGGGKKIVLDYSAPEEQGLNIQKITDENANVVVGNGTQKKFSYNFPTSRVGGCKEMKFYWWPDRKLAISPDGTELAYVTYINKQRNIMIRKTTANSASTQRTFRNVNDVSWAKNGNLYFSDGSDDVHEQIASTNAHSGSIIRQLTSNNSDFNPQVSSDGKLMLFTRFDRTGPSVWSLNLEDNSLTSCARGFNPIFIGNSKEEFLCVRNSTAGVSEIWRVNYVKGQETVLLSDKNRGFTNPVISPDGQWILVEGNSKSLRDKEQNLDIFAVKIDGSNFTQITYHSADDCCPTWSADGKYIYFLSTRGSKDGSYNVWRMRFAL